MVAVRFGVAKVAAEPNKVPAVAALYHWKVAPALPEAVKIAFVPEQTEAPAAVGGFAPGFTVICTQLDSPTYKLQPITLAQRLYQVVTEIIGGS